jgi:hypothetical protein
MDEKKAKVLISLIFFMAIHLMRIEIVVCVPSIIMNQWR